MIQVQAKEYKYFSMDTFGKRLKAKREAKSLTQDELASMVGKASKQAISNWENSKAEPSISEVKELAKILGTTAGYLIDGEEGNIMKEPTNDYVLISKDKLIDLQDKALNNLIKQTQNQ